MRGKKPGTPNYQLDVLMDIIDKKRPTSLADWNDVAAAYHIRSKEQEPRKGITLRMYFANYLCKKKKDARCLTIMRQIVGPEGAYASDSDEAYDESENGDDDDDDDDSFSAADSDDNFKESADSEDEADDDEVEVIEVHETEPEPVPHCNTAALLQQLNNTIGTLSTRLGQSPSTQASMPQILAMFSLHTQTQAQNHEKLLRDMEQRWQQQYHKQAKLFRGIQDRVEKIERQVKRESKKVEKLTKRMNNERRILKEKTTKKRKRSEK
jgi:hypothetical protein